MYASRCQDLFVYIAPEGIDPQIPAAGRIHVQKPILRRSGEVGARDVDHASGRHVFPASQKNVELHQKRVLSIHASHACIMQCVRSLTASFARLKPSRT